MTSTPPPAVLMAELRRLHAAGDMQAAMAQLDDILSAHPDFMPAHRWRLDQLLAQGALDEALTLARGLRFEFPDMRAMATVKQATALDRLGQVGAARRVLFELFEDGAADVPAYALLGMLLLRDGSLNRAAQMFQAALDAAPAHPGALRGLIDVALKRGRPQEALDLCDRAADLEALPHDVIQSRRAQGLEQMGRVAEAIDVLAALVSAGQATEQNRMALAWLYRKVGDLEAAGMGFAAVLAQSPDRIPAVQGHVAVLRQQGAMEAALAVCDTAIAHASPAPDVFHLLRTQVQMAAGRPGQAAADLEQVLIYRAGSGPLYLELGRAYVQAGALDKAFTALDTCMGYDDVRIPALLEQAEITRRQGAHAKGVALLQGAVDASQDPDPRLVLALCEALIRAEDTRPVAALLQGLIDRDAALSDAQVEQMMVLAERQTLPDITSHLIAGLAARPSLSQALAHRVLRLAHITADPVALRPIIDALCAKLTLSERDVFRAAATALIEGPDAAVAQVRGLPNIDQTPTKARTIGRYLVDGGRAGLALRYVRRALRRWPEDRALIMIYVHACSVSQNHAAGHAHLDRLVAAAPDMDLERERLMLMYGQGADTAVFERATARHDAGLPGLHPQQYLLLCLACGDLDRALSAQHSMRSDPGSTSRMAAHFTTGLHGRMMTDLQVYRTLEARALATGASAEATQAKLAEQYYYPAKACVDRWAAQACDAPPQTERAVPRRIFQYWDNDTVPADVAALIAGWQGVPGFEHVLMTRARALQMLRRQFSPRLVTAFQRARHVTEESDLLRLCLIYKFGGIYSDADDKVVGDIATLAGLGSGLVVTREPIGAIANNTLIAPPGNPVLRIALNMTVRALLARDADGAWFKSGPGMLTRAAAVYLRDADPEEARAHLTLLEGDTLRQFIEPHIRLPYKTTAKYWNAKDKDISQRVLDSLAGLTAKVGGAAAARAS